MKYFIAVALLIISYTNAFAAEETFFLPDEKKAVLQVQHDMIKNAQKTIDVAAYSLTSCVNNSFVDDLVEASKRGVKVRVYRDKNQSLTEASHGIDKTADRILGLAGVEVRLKEHGYPIMHNKFFIVDSNLVLWGSMNFTCIGPSEDNVVQISSEQGPAFQKAFNTLWAR